MGASKDAAVAVPPLSGVFGLQSVCFGPLTSTNLRRSAPTLASSTGSNTSDGRSPSRQPRGKFCVFIFQSILCVVIKKKLPFSRGCIFYLFFMYIFFGRGGVWIGRSNNFGVPMLTDTLFDGYLQFIFIPCMFARRKAPLWRTSCTRMRFRPTQT